MEETRVSINPNLEACSMEVVRLGSRPSSPYVSKFSARAARSGKTPVLEATEARQLLDSIDVTTPVGLRDWALIALMAFSFAQISAALAMRVEDV
jgi:integrase